MMRGGPLCLLDQRGVVCEAFHASLEKQVIERALGIQRTQRIRYVDTLRSTAIAAMKIRVGWNRCSQVLHRAEHSRGCAFNHDPAKLHTPVDR